MVDPFNIGLQKLSEFQLKVLEECLDKGYGGLSLPMGSGKTLLAILIGLHQANDIDSSDPVLIVAAKNLIASWEFEIQKFFGNTLSYEILHTDSVKKMGVWKPRPGIHLLLTTPEVVAKSYKEHLVENKFTLYENINPFTVVKYYHKPVKPFLGHPVGNGVLFSKRWPCYIVDEAQKYTKISSQRAQGLSAVCAQHRWVLSGTLFDEPTVERILGYHLILDLPDTPRCLPDMEEYIRSAQFKGLRKTCVYRNKNKNFVEPEINQVIVSHDLFPEEASLYCSLRQTLRVIRSRSIELRLIGDKENAKKFSSYLLAMISYLRQCLVCPLIPISSVALDMADFNSRSELSGILMEQINDLGINDWLNDVQSVRSSRISKVLETLDVHIGERIVVFSCFRSCIDVLTTFLPRDRPIFSIKASNNMAKRGQILKDFAESKNGVLLLTYELGAEGLNLQCAATVCLLDFWWNDGKTQQAIARVNRYGQTAKTVNIYLFTSNTGIEKALFEKQQAKQLILQEWQTGPSQRKIPRMNVREVIQLIERDDNIQLIRRIRE